MSRPRYDKERALELLSFIERAVADLEAQASVVRGRLDGVRNEIEYVFQDDDVPDDGYEERQTRGDG